VGLAPLVSSLLVAGPVAASELSWSGPAECGQGEQLGFQLQQALGAPLEQVGHLQLQVHVEQLQPDARAVLRIAESTHSTSDGVKKRLLTAPDCAALVDTLAVAIALAVEASVPAVSPPAAAAPAPAAPVPSPTSEADAEPVQAPKPGQRLVPRVTALLAGDVGSLPAPALGLSLGAALDSRFWQVELLGTLWLEQQPSLVGDTRFGAELSLATGALLGCALPGGAASQESALAVSLCGGLELGRLAGEGTGISRPRQRQALWLAPGLHAGLSWQLPRTQLRLVARAGAVLPLERRELVLDDLGTVHQPANLAARAALGLDWMLE
jgi:hypothetical protein